jgi:hypothetical protein
VNESSLQSKLLRIGDVLPGATAAASLALRIQTLVSAEVPTPGDDAMWRGAEYFEQSGGNSGSVARSSVDFDADALAWDREGDQEGASPDVGNAVAGRVQVFDADIENVEHGPAT